MGNNRKCTKGIGVARRPVKAMAVAGLENMMSFESVADVVLRAATEYLRKQP